MAGYCLFKLKHDIRVESKIWIAKEEIEKIIKTEVEPVPSLAALIKRQPFSLLEDYVIHRITRLPYLGRVQGFMAYGMVNEDGLKALADKLTYIREFYYITTERDLISSFLKGDASDCSGLKDVGPATQIFIQNEPFLATLIMIPTQTLLELGSETLKLPYVTFTKHEENLRHRIVLMEKGVERGIDEMFYHILKEHSRQPWLGLYKQHIGDYVDWAFSDFRTWGLHFIHHHEGKADPWLARSVVNLLDIPPGGTLLDPFCGSGTFLADAPLLGINVVGVDINPLSCLIARVKCNAAFLPIHELREAVVALGNTALRLFSNRTLSFEKLFSDVKHYIDSLSAGDLIKDFLYVILSRQTKDSQKRNVKNIWLTFMDDMIHFYLLTYCYQKILERMNVNPTPNVRIILGDSRNIDTYVSHVDGIATSPPYFDAIDYVKSSKISIELLGLKPEPETVDRLTIGSKAASFINQAELHSLPISSQILVKQFLTHGRLKKAEIVLNYLCSMRDCLRGFYKILREGGRCIFVVGRYHHWTFGEQNYEVDGAQVLIDLGEQAGFALEAELTHNISKIEAGDRIKEESIIVWKKGLEKSARDPNRSERIFREYTKRSISSLL
ncbi:MAG: DNA methyltransferase [Candidatus Caldarchaeum sp.]|uniref:Ribosomal RNA large subunit methyltransferase K/L-like methyltransferase domain-containing protein n=1 Tax=Caldiarchaeum subterraneum TaxID=311458 RepID=A0A7C4I260_CALS0